MSKWPIFRPFIRNDSIIYKIDSKTKSDYSVDKHLKSIRIKKSLEFQGVLIKNKSYIIQHLPFNIYCMVINSDNDSFYYHPNKQDSTCIIFTGDTTYNYKENEIECYQFKCINYKFNSSNRSYENNNKFITGFIYIEEYVFFIEKKSLLPIFVNYKYWHEYKERDSTFHEILNINYNSEIRIKMLNELNYETDFELIKEYTIFPYSESI